MRFSQYTRREMNRPWSFVSNLFAIDERNREYYKGMIVEVKNQMITFSRSDFTVDIHLGDWIIIDNQGKLWKDLSYLPTWKQNKKL